MVCAAVLASIVISCLHPARTLPSQLVWTHLFLLQNLFVDSLKNPDLPHLWSVGAEMQLYLITPLLMDCLVDRKTSQRRPWAMPCLVLLSLLSVAFRGWLILGPPGEEINRVWPPGIAYLNPLGRLSPYVSGIAVHFSLNDQIDQIERQMWRPISVLLDLGAFAVLVLAGFCGQKPEPPPSLMYAWFPRSTVQWIAVLWPPLFGWVLARSIFQVLNAGGAWRCLRRVLESRLWKALALLSYSAYVVQQFALLLLLAPLMKELDLNWSNGTTPGGAVWRYALVFPLFAMMSCAVALPFHVFLEMPCIRLGRRIGTATPATRSKAATAKEELEDGLPEIPDMVPVAPGHL